VKEFQPNPGSQYANLFMTSEKVNGNSNVESSKLQGLHISHLIIPCSRIADHIQHLICLRIPFYHETGILIMQITVLRCFYGYQPFNIREVSHRYENDTDNEHFITLCVRTCVQIMTSSRAISFRQVSELLRRIICFICFDMWSFSACKSYAIRLFEKELKMKCSLSLLYSYWCETSLR
jgi:hypothetical protein